MNRNELQPRVLHVLESGNKSKTKELWINGANDVSQTSKDPTIILSVENVVKNVIKDVYNQI